MASTRWVRSVLAPVALVGLVVACSGAGDRSEGAGDADRGGSREAGAAGDTAAAPASAAEIEAFTGEVDAFYDVPDPLPEGAPGDLIRTMPIEAPAGQTGLRIMYHSTDDQGDDRAVTGIAYFPSPEAADAAEAPDDGWPIYAWAHGTSGIAAQCAPSRIPLAPPDFGVQGVTVATDYIGLGPNGELHPYLNAAAEGNAVIDSVAAVRNLPDAHAGDRWVVAGHSQGGHAALITNETAAERLPGAELLGTVAIAPGAQLSESYGDEVQTRIITTMVLFGAAADDPEIDPAAYLSPEAYDVATGVVEDTCLGEIISTMLPLAPSEDFWTTNPRDDDVGSAWLERNDPGQVVSDSPLLLVQGGQDLIVLPARTDALFDRLCDLGQVVQRVDLPNATHDTEPGEAAAQISDWLAARLAGDPAPDDC
jgi:pimeloyl-ACP methyl ester carboxylesterase